MTWLQSQVNVIHHFKGIKAYKQEEHESPGIRAANKIQISPAEQNVIQQPIVWFTEAFYNR